MKSLEAFHSLCAVVTFILSLWTKLESICVAPFQSAFWGLANHFDAPVQRSWLDQFTKTHVCSLALGACTGCFIDPYTSPWGHGWTVLFKLEFKFGLFGGQTSSIHHLLSQASLASFTSHSFHLLNILNQPYLLSEMPRCCNSNLLSYPLDSLHKNFSLLLQTLLQHHLRCLSLHLHLQSHPIPLLILINIKGRPWLVEGKQKHEALESLSDRQSRKDQEISAAQKGYSKTCTMFRWEEIQGHHLHVKVDCIEVPGLWHDYPASQCVYHGHINEWDLCPPIPPFSEVLTQEDLAKMQQYDDELDASDNAP